MQKRLARWGEQFELSGFAKWIALSAALGAIGGLVAVVFHLLVDLATAELFGRVAGTVEGGIMPGSNPALVLVVPALGGLGVGLIKKWTRSESDGEGAESVVRSFHRMKGRVRKRVASVTTITSALTIGSGGSVGQEGPVGQIGASIGSSLSTALGFSDRDRRLFLMAGASAGIGALFGSPLGGALYLPEVMYRREEFEGDAIIPCVVSSSVAYAVFTSILGAKRAIEIPPEILHSLQFGGLAEIGVYFVLGLLCAVLGGAFVASVRGTTAFFERSKRLPRVLRPMVGGAIIGVMALLIGQVTPGLGISFGGYGIAGAALQGTVAVPVLALLLLFKIAATAVTVGSGGAGGVFAPALTIGAMLGGFVGLAGDRLFPGLNLDPAAFALVGMGGFFAGVGKTPIAAVVMVSEMTGNYALLAPLMIVSVVHMAFSTGWSIYPSQVNRPLDSPAHTGDYIVDVLQSLKVSDILDQASTPTLIPEHTTLRRTMQIVSNARDTHFPVVNQKNELVGIFSLSDLRRIFLEHEALDVVIAGDFMRDQVATITPNDSLHDVQRLFTRRAVSALPVVSPENPRQVLALLRRNEVGRAYSDRLQSLKDTPP
ncbi:H(+)/Cl(-) exchange transporter ClcA [Planctomycetes bacterium Poly30]|uniref:H(+)/Cl(-) exchange transporter ClcA n=1 Tax=Saltatorellus ferox TaxID=2528018 RepID=A0A518EM66_9BACT|nr:H(+)/Cl(-) exchange transporter ClcA [Planctomycetes bacterium Poly30]